MASAAITGLVQVPLVLTMGRRILHASKTGHVESVSEAQERVAAARTQGGGLPRVPGAAASTG